MSATIRRTRVQGTSGDLYRKSFAVAYMQGHRSGINYLFMDDLVEQGEKDMANMTAEQRLQLLNDVYEELKKLGLETEEQMRNSKFAYDAPAKPRGKGKEFAAALTKRGTKRKASAKSASTSKTAKRKASAKSAGTSTTGKRRFKPGTVALREIRRYQKSSDKLIRALPFQRVVRAAARDATSLDSIRMQAGAIDAIQEATEAYLVGLYEDANLAAIHAGRVTLSAKDLDLALRVRGK